MYKILFTVFVMLSSFAFTACESPLFQKLFKEQEWSENYALEDGVRCTAPEMVDGDINTTGKAVFPEGVYGRTVYGAFPSAEVDIILPEKKSIRKIVIRSEELEDFSVLESSYGMEGEWKLIKELNNNKEKVVEIRTSVVTDKIKIRARGKTKFESGGRFTRTYSFTEPEIQEIELYGFK